jgi:hypothetical protein
MSDDFYSRAEYRQLVAAWRDRGAVAVADTLGEYDDWYGTYTWYLVAISVGEAGGADGVEVLEMGELVCAEDCYLASLQVAIWLARGIHVDADAAQALARLVDAVEPLLELDPEDASDEKHARAAALRRFGFPAPDAAVDLATVNALVDLVVARLGWPTTLDVTVPLGPAIPDDPFWIHPRHRPT